MGEKHLHIVSFDVPYPPNYGGVIDVYYKIKYLSQQGVKVHLHCFEYGRPIRQELTEFCYTVKSYPRKKGLYYFLSSLPYIVNTRQDEDLINNLMKDSYPVLFEGLHCSFYLNDFRLAGRKRFVRMHNIESDYYSALAEVEKNIFKKIYFKSESKKLNKFQKSLIGAHGVFAISEKDKEVLLDYFKTVEVIPAFHQFDEPAISIDTDDFAFYHGNLAVGENNRAALFLVTEVFNHLPFKLIIAGSKPSKTLIKEVAKYPNIQLLENISLEEINNLIKKARINVLPTFQSTGIKLKLLNALFAGKWCLVNSSMVAGSGLEELCLVVDGAEDWRKKINQIFNKEFDFGEIIKRKEILNRLYNNNANACKLIEHIWG